MQYGRCVCLRQDHVFRHAESQMTLLSFLLSSFGRNLLRGMDSSKKIISVEDNRQSPEMSSGGSSSSCYAVY